MSDVWSVEIPIAVETVEEKCKAVNLVKDLLPTHVLCFPQVKKELQDHRTVLRRDMFELTDDAISFVPECRGDVLCAGDAGKIFGKNQFRVYTANENVLVVRSIEDTDLTTWW